MYGDTSTCISSWAVLTRLWGIADVWPGPVPLLSPLKKTLLRDSLLSLSGASWPADPVQHHDPPRGPGVDCTRSPDRVHQPPGPGAVLHHAAVTRALKHGLVPWLLPGVRSLRSPEWAQPAALLPVPGRPGLYHGLTALDKLPEQAVSHSHPNLVAGHGHPAARIEKEVFVILKHHPWTLHYEVLWKSKNLTLM